MKKCVRALSLISIFIVLFISANSGTVFALNPDAYLEINTVTVIESGNVLVSSGAGWSYNEASNTLTLDGYNGRYILGRLMGSIVLNIVGENKITESSFEGALNFGLDSSLTITGDETARLTVVNTLASGTAIGISGIESLLVNGKLTVDVTVSGAGSTLLSSGPLTLTGGCTVISNGGANGAGLTALAINITEGSSLTESSSNAFKPHIYGSGSTSLSISGGVITAAGPIYISENVADTHINIAGGTTVLPAGINNPGSTPVTLVISGGSFNAPQESLAVQPVNDNGNNVQKTEITLDGLGAGVRITELEGMASSSYGLTDVYTDADGKIYLWLPTGTSLTAIVTENGVYEGEIPAGSSVTLDGENAAELPADEPVEDNKADISNNSLLIIAVIAIGVLLLLVIVLVIILLVSRKKKPTNNPPAQLPYQPNTNGAYMPTASPPQQQPQLPPQQLQPPQNPQQPQAPQPQQPYQPQ